MMKSQLLLGCEGVKLGGNSTTPGKRRVVSEMVRGMHSERRPEVGYQNVCQLLPKGCCIDGQTHPGQEV